MLNQLFKDYSSRFEQNRFAVFIKNTSFRPNLSTDRRQIRVLIKHVSKYVKKDSFQTTAVI